MKVKLKDKKVVYTIIGIISLLLIVIGITYAYWLVTKTQTNTNTITSACLDITLSDEANDISLTNQFPISDEEGMSLTPYTFTVTNNCNTSVDYQVNLESIGDETTAIKSSALKVALNDNEGLFSSYAEVGTTIEGAYEARRLGFSRLAPSGNEGSSDTYSLRIWIDEDAPISEMNKTFQSKISITIGQGIEIKYEEGTLAYNILSNYGGSAGIETLSIEPSEMIIATGNIYMPTSTNYYYGTEVSYDDEEGKYILGGTVVQATTTECRNGTKTCGKYTLKQTTSAATSVTLYEVTDFQSSGYFVIGNTIEYTTEFGKVTTANDAGVYKTKDDLGDSYYFRGAPTNNYVEFGTYAEDTTLVVADYSTEEIKKTIEVKAGTPMYWRIVRINGDGSIRLIYDGTEKVANGVKHTATIAYTSYNNCYNTKCVGYTYDTSDADATQIDSTIKGVVDTWYDKHLEATYGEFMADSIFCNDRNGATTDESGNTYYAPYYRLETNKAPVLTCTNKNDRYTVNDATNGNTLLSNPVGLLTADEAFMAGGTTASNRSYYLYSDEYYWTSSPSCWDNVDVLMWFVDYSGSVDDSYYNFVDDFYPGVRPVINLKADVLFEGNGSLETPYIITTN